MSLESMHRKIADRPPLNFGTIFSETIELFKKVWLQGFVILLLGFATILPFYIMIYIPMIAMGITDPDMLRNEDPSIMVIISMSIIMPIVYIGVLTFAMALNAAFLRICRLKDLNETGDGDYFYFFKQGRLGKILMVSLIMLGLSLVGMMTCGIALIYFVVPMSLFPAFLAFEEELSAMEVVKASFVLGNKNWLVIFGLIIIVSLIAELGVLLCCVGILFTAMLSKIPMYFMFKHGVGFEEDASQF
ncbi:hypothetical protein J8L85_00580 [Maribacter sp. MMG018]|uniref:hypothetical protein n=1 Tax=Maribacter sp. MMG018 TaxID=2822688 RepID=UPI001B39A5EA|nr:hypothetical protein [Maribacter sp. MMG018]MBQ4912910.1 hypothetical protein [Maribacter sp. MMG018]